MTKESLKNPLVVMVIIEVAAYFLGGAPVVIGEFGIFGSAYFVFPFFIAILAGGLAYYPIDRIQKRFIRLSVSYALSALVLAAIQVGIMILWVVGSAYGVY